MARLRGGRFDVSAHRRDRQDKLPDLYTVMQLLGSKRTAARIRAAMDRL